MFDEPDEKTTNEDLMGRVRLGNKHAFEVLIRRHQQSVLNFIFRFMGNRTDAEDLTQEVFLRIWKAAGTYKSEAKFTTWLYRIATNLCINKQRAIRIRRLFAYPCCAVFIGRYCSWWRPVLWYLDVSRGSSDKWRAGLSALRWSQTYNEHTPHRKCSGISVG